jgi:hypothetical protein
VNAVLVDVGMNGPAPAVSAAAVAVPVQNPPPPGRGEEFGKASPIALVVIVLLALATIVLVRSMTKRIKRLPASFDAPPADGDEAAASERDAEGPRA